MGIGDEFGRPTKASSYGRLAGIAAAVVMLAAVGAFGGWLLAGDPPAAQGLSPAATTAPPTDTVTSIPAEPATPTPSPSARSSTSGATTGLFTLPDLSDRDFMDVRRELRARGLGWRLVFGASSADRSVERTRPAAGAQVRRGITVTVYVRGAAPIATVPGVTGLTCKEAAAIVVDHGLYPAYETGRTGRVVQQDPEPPGDLHWNDVVRLFCGTQPPGPTASATP
jgi:hypothetical protein